MRTSFYFGLLLTFIGLMSCSSQPKIQTEAPFTVERPTVEYWVGGREESGTQMRFEARWNPIDPSSITLDSLYFRGRVMKAESQESETGFTITATFIENKPLNAYIQGYAAPGAALFFWRGGDERGRRPAPDLTRDLGHEVSAEEPRRRAP